MTPIISVCIPVYNTEPFLLQCLRSVFVQDFDDFEIVIVSDASRGKDGQGRSAKKIIKLAQKECNAFRKAHGLSKIKIRFIEHRENHGILEVRRTLCYEANGEYICFVDSDDVLESGALRSLLQIPGSSPRMTDSPVSLTEAPVSLSGLTRQSFDIIQGKSTSGTFDQAGNFVPSKINRYNSITIGELKEHQIFHEWVTNGKITGVVWGKLIKRSLLVKAFENIPYSECNMAEDYLISFFVNQFAKVYVGIDSKVYRYRITSGVSSSRKIDTLRKWEMICSTANVFTVIVQWINENESTSKITPEELQYIKRQTSVYLANNLKQMKATVVPELQEQARQLLCDYWGEHFVGTVEERLSGQARQ